MRSEFSVKRMRMKNIAITRLLKVMDAHNMLNYGEKIHERFYWINKTEQEIIDKTIELLKQIKP